MKMKRLKQFLPSPDQSPTKSRLLSDEKVIKETSDHLKDLTNEVLKEFRAFKIKPNLRSRPAIEALNDGLLDIGDEISYISYHYGAFMRKLRASDRDTLDQINNWLGWLTIEYHAKQAELHDAYPVLVAD